MWLNRVPLESTSHSVVQSVSQHFFISVQSFFSFSCLSPPNFYPFLISQYLTFRFLFRKRTKIESITWCSITLFATQNVRFGFVCRSLSFFSSVQDVLYCSNPLRMKAFAVADCSNFCCCIYGINVKFQMLVQNSKRRDLSLNFYSFPSFLPTWNQ